MPDEITDPSIAAAPLRRRWTALSVLAAVASVVAVVAVGWAAFWSPAAEPVGCRTDTVMLMPATVPDESNGCVGGIGCLLWPETGVPMGVNR
ncbi:hypothetical protein IU459_33735 [Nocardia amamiensis]|uniref:Uncharacterized protein n=1 Tax=Nocardia amamiensis TaxID=404578 RepID=A0ABS0D0Z0_9NOCA|nr:hypothetical protein [Nocardia amamiensis]MBF6302466.1 hypothetical protein [Nocardia amamiensis]